MDLYIRPINSMSEYIFSKKKKNVLIIDLRIREYEQKGRKKTETDRRSHTCMGRDHTEE